MKLLKVMRVLKAMSLLYAVSMRKMTAGEIAQWTGMPYSSVRRYLQCAENSELVESELVDYKTSGKHVFWMTGKGIDWLQGYREVAGNTMRKFTSRDFGMSSREIARRLEGEGYKFDYDLWSWVKDGIVAFDGLGMTFAQSTYNAWNETSTPKLKK